MQDFKNAMSKRTDEELLKIVTVDRKDYQPLAVIAAEEEIKNRNLDVALIEQINTTITEEFELQKQFNLRKSGKFTRLYGFAIDTIAAVIITSIVLFPFTSNVQNSIGLLIFSFIYFMYNVITEHKFQKTLGKFVTKTRVVTTENNKPTLIIIIRRTLCRFFPFDQFSYLFTINGFHDRFSNTTVIKDQER